MPDIVETVILANFGALFLLWSSLCFTQSFPPAQTLCVFIIKHI